jgi:hypothetical protein
MPHPRFGGWTHLIRRLCPQQTLFFPTIRDTPSIQPHLDGAQLKSRCMWDFPFEKIPSKTVLGPLPSLQLSVKTPFGLAKSQEVAFEPFGIRAFFLQSQAMAKN